jgi:hypothetical protein
MIRTLAAFLALASAAQAQVTFDQARADASKREAYVQQLFADVKGVVKAVVYLPTQEAAAKDAVKAAYKEDGREFYFEREIKGVLAKQEPAPLRVLPYYREDAVAGAQQKTGVLVAGDLFTLASEDEVKSVVDDFAKTVIRIREDGLKTEDRELDANIPALKVIAHTSLIKLWAQSVQLEKIFKGERKVSDPFREAAVREYLATVKAFGVQLLKEKKIYDDNNENTLQKEIIDYLDFVWAFLHKRIEAAGYKHVLKDKAAQDYALEKK